jgi:hypothetical protein
MSQAYLNSCYLAVSPNCFLARRFCLRYLPVAPRCTTSMYLASNLSNLFGTSYMTDGDGCRLTRTTDSIVHVGKQEADREPFFFFFFFFFFPKGRGPGKYLIRRRCCSLPASALPMQARELQVLAWVASEWCSKHRDSIVGSEPSRCLKSPLSLEVSRAMMSIHIVAFTRL